MQRATLAKVEKRIEDGWRPARLIPVSGIRGAEDQEMRATSALLAVMMAVPQFGKALLSKAGAPAGNISTYIEVPFKVEEKRGSRPDGAINVTRGGNSWRALVEVKTGDRELDAAQIEAYLDRAREHRFDAVITISSEMTTALDSHPLAIDRKRTRKVSLHHWSWVEVLSEAIIQREHRKIADTDQEWILGELISYLEHPNSGALQFHDMGPNWATVRDGARESTLRRTDHSVQEIAERWDQFVQYLCLYLGRDLGLKVNQVLSRSEQVDPAVRKAYLVNQLVDAGYLDGVLRIPRAVGDVRVVASIRGRTVTASLEVPAPTGKRNQTRINWLLRQLEGAHAAVRVEAVQVGGRTTLSGRLSDLRENPTKLLPTDKGKLIRAFIVSQTDEMGIKRSGGRGSFIGEASDLVLRFYREVVQEIKAWSAAPAKLPESRDRADSDYQPEGPLDQIRQQGPTEAT